MPFPRTPALTVDCVAIDGEGRLLLIRRKNPPYAGKYALPGGFVDVGETVEDACRRELMEETGIKADRLELIGIYSDPGHVFAYDDGEVRQEFSICLACTITSGSLSVSSESTDVRFFAPEDIPDTQIHESILKRIQDYLSDQPPVLR